MKNADHNFWETTVPKIGEILAQYVNRSQKLETQVLQQQEPSQLIKDLNTEQLFRAGFKSQEEVLDFTQTYLKNTNHLHHPHYMGHQVAVPHPKSGIPDWIHGTANNPSSLYEMGPAGGALEGFMIHWMLDQLGWFKGTDYTDFNKYPDNGSGVLTHGGSVANLTALSAARAAIAPEAWMEGSPSDLVILGPSTSHYSIARAISIMGMGQKAYAPVEVDSNEVMIIEDLERVYSEETKKGKRVMAVVANACATSTGLYDPIEAIGQFCEKNNIWYHIDGAHGAVALLSDKEKNHVKGIEKADSLIWDAHKMMRVPALCTAVLFKNQWHQFNNFKQKGSYVFHPNEVVGTDSMPYTIECTKSALGTKLFWSFALEGEQKIIDYVDHCYQLALDFYELIQSQVDFDAPYVPESNILCFRYEGKNPSDAFQLQLRYQLIETGDFYITSCEMNHKRYLRVVLIHPETQIKHLIALLDKIRAVASQIVTD